MTERSENDNNPLEFTTKDQLRLLQLQALKDVHQRRTAPAETAAAADQSQEDQAAQVPPRWRLLAPEVQLYKWQEEALGLWLPERRGTIKVATGAGKTLFALAAAQELQNDQVQDLVVAIVVPTIPLMHQWAKELEESNLPAQAIGMLGGGHEFRFTNGIKVAICVINSARKKLPGLVSRAGVAGRLLLIVDECHRAHASKSKQIFQTNPAFTLGLSATPETVDQDDAVPSDEAYAESPAGQVLGPIIFTMSLARCLEDGLLAPFEIWHVGLPLIGDEGVQYSTLSRKIAELRKALYAVYRRRKSKRPFIPWCKTMADKGKGLSEEAGRFLNLAQRRKRLLYRAQARMVAVQGILNDSLADPDSRMILFHEEIDSVERIFGAVVRAGLPAVLEHSKLANDLRAANLEAFRTGVARIIVSAKSLIEGFNVPSADVGIITASTSSVRQRIQSLGRLLRKKAGQREARVYVLYIHGTEDERIYEQADWDSITGATRNRYFTWQPEEDEAWPAGLVEESGPPRVFLPSPFDIDEAALEENEPYPARPEGVEIQVDQDGNLRDVTGSLVHAGRHVVQAVLDKNPYRKGLLSHAGHIIVRTDRSGGSEPAWVFLGKATKSSEKENESGAPIVLKVKSSRGMPRLALSVRGGEQYALGSEKAKDIERGRAAEALLDWIHMMEEQLHRRVKFLHWNGKTSYWIEVENERHEAPKGIAPLEFAERNPHP